MKTVKEGAAVILVPAQSLTRKAEAFYNPEMEYQRDLTMSALRVYSQSAGKKLSVCDPLAGTGVRSIRIAKEVDGIEKMVINDINPRAFRLIKKNVKINGLKRGVKVDNKNANLLFLENPREFDYIDIDPFGSPLNFIFNAGFALKPRSMLACTATDTGALCGSFPSTCFSRYGIMAVKTDFFKETGIRVLITATMLELAKHGLAFSPVFSHANHYFRAVGTVSRSRSALSRQAGQIRLLTYCRECCSRSFEIAGKCPVCGHGLDMLGPLWTGKIKDTAFCGSMLDDLTSRNFRSTRELRTCVKEIDEPFYYDVHSMCRVTKKTPGKIDSLIEKLQNQGHAASRTHLSDTGIKTNASYGEFIKIL